MPQNFLPEPDEQAHIFKASAAALAAAALQLEAIVDRGGDERDLQQFLATHAYFILLTPVYDHFFAISEAPLGAEYCADFALYGSCNGPWWTLIELERSDDRLFTKAGNPSAKLTHAMRQVRDWRRWIGDNPDYFGSRFENHMGMRRPHLNTGIIIGRRAEITNRDREHLLQYNRESPYDWVMTYDGLVERARALTKLKDDTPIFGKAYTWSEYSSALASGGIRNVVGSSRYALWNIDADFPGDSGV